MGTNIIVNREKCNQTIMYIQRQYDQIMHMAQTNKGNRCSLCSLAV